MKQKNLHHKLIRTILLCGMITGIFLSLPQLTRAVTISIEELTSPISSDPFIVTTHITGASAGTNYLKIDLYKENTTNYFGETYNGTDWYKTTDNFQYFPITIQTGTEWQGQVKGKLGTPTQTEYDGTGQYKLRIRRYTQSGYNSQEALASEKNITIITPTNTPTPINTPIITPSPTTTAQLTSIPAPTTTPMSYGNIFISEVMPYPADDNTSEWIELYNNNDSTVSLDNWYIDDGENTGSSPKLFSISIPSKQYAVIDVSLFNNDGDTVRLLDFNKIEKDSFSYTYSTKGITYGRTSFSSNDFCEQDPTKGMPNNPCRVNESDKSPSPAPSSPTPSPTAIHTPTPKEVLISPTAFSFSQSPIIVDSHATTAGTDTLLFSDTPSLPSQQQGSVLSAETHRDHTTAKTYVFGLSSSSALISLVNIGNIIRKMIQRLKFNSN